MSSNKHLLKNPICVTLNCCLLDIKEVSMFFYRFIISAIFIADIVAENCFAIRDEVIKGQLQSNSSTLIYEVRLSTAPKKTCISCRMQDESSSDESDSSEGTYTVSNAPWLYNTSCRGIFLREFSKAIVKLNGGLPSLTSIKTMASHVANLSNVSITSEKQFLEINGTQGKAITCLRFEGINLTERFFCHFSKIIDSELNKIEFIRCSLDEGVTFADILDGRSVINLSIINCSISEDDLSELLTRINSYCIKRIDLSENHLTSTVVPILKEKIRGTFSLTSINLEGNNLDSESILEIMSLCHE